MDGATRPTAPLTREEVAHREVGHTTITAGVARSLTIAFLLLAAVVPLFEVSRGWIGDAAAAAPWRHLQQIPDAVRRAPAGDSAWQALLTNNRAVLAGLHAFETDLEDQSRIGRLLRPPAQKILSGTLGAGNEQAYVGRGGWLFYREDVEYVLGRGFLDPDVMRARVAAADEWSAPPQPDPARAILAFDAHLKRLGITLIVVPVPVKPSVHPEQLARRRPADEAIDNPDYQRFISDLQRAGVRVFDTTPVLRQATQRGGVSQYLAMDTHWRPEAMELVADQLATTVREIAAPAAPSDPGYRVETLDVTNRGDTYAMLDLPEGADVFPPERVTVRRIVNGDGSPWRASQDSDVLLLGDSFTNIYSLESMGWGTSAGLGEQLSFALGRPLDRIVQNADGAYATREALQRAGADRLKGKKVVIWQFTTRELAFGDWRIY